jgi:outer membrane receptor protein involved in Fe transport
MICGAVALALAAAPQAFAQTAPTNQQADRAQDVPDAMDAPLAESNSQIAGAPDDDATEVGEVVVTGSRLRSRDLVANSPVETVTAEELQERATITVETFLNTLPQVVPSFSESNNNPGSGQAFVDLRGLGTNRNLVLIDGRRVVPSTSTSVVDLNIIPTALIERVELVTGGASAVYGADAVAGVVNFILKDDFEGVEVDAQYQISERGDGEQFATSLTLGGNFADDRGNAVLNFSYVNREEIGKGAREHSAQARNTTSFFPSGTYRTAGNQPTQAAVDAVFGRYGVAPGAVARTGGGTGFGFNGDGTLFATGSAGAAFEVQNFRRNQSEIATNFFPDFFSFNFEPFNKLVLPLDRKTVSVLADYDVNDVVNVYGRATFANYTASTALAPSPAPTAANPTVVGNLNEFTIPVTNPFIPADLRTLLASRTGNNAVLPGTGATEDFAYRFRTLSLGPRLSTNDRSVYQVTAGTKLTLPMEWSGDVYASYGYYTEEEIQTGNLGVRRFEQLLDSPTGGTEFCANGFNPFGVGFLSDECRTYVSVTGKNRTTIESNFAEAVFSGPLFALPAGQVQMAVGTSYRSNDYNLIPDQSLQPGEVAGFNSSQPLSGFLDFYDIFSEVSIPLLRDVPFARELTLVLGGRYSDANLSGGVESYKAEGSYVPVEGLRFRGSYQRAVRSPNISELFSPQLEDNPEVLDPCNATNATGGPNPARTAQVLALCQTQGAQVGFNSAFVQSYTQGNAQIQALSGGNPNLDPEIADTYTFGVVWRPDLGIPFIRNFATSLDYYNIEITETVGTPDPSVIVNRCYNLQDNANPNFSPTNPNCALFTRSAGDFSIIDLEEVLTNQGLLATSGIDFTFGFNTELSDLRLPVPGRLGFQTAITWVEKFEDQTAVGDPILDYVGTIGDDPGDYIPQWRANVNFEYEVGRLGLDLRGRYLGSAKHELDVPVEDPASTGVDSTWYWDLASRFGVTDTVEVRFGVINLFDEEIKIYEPAVESGTDPSVFDVVGRRYYAGINLRF